MNALRKILMPLLLIPLGAFIYMSIRPEWQWENPALETLFALVGIPIVIINFFAWFYPEIIKAYFPVKDDWGEGRGKPVIAATAISALIAFTCVGVGAVSAVAGSAPRPTFAPSPVQPVTATAFAHSLQLLASAIDSGERVAASTPRESPQVEITPDQTGQIPVSGGGATDSPMLSTAETDVASAALEPTEFVSAKAMGSTSAVPTGTAFTKAAGTTSVVPTGTARPSGSCVPATSEYMDAVRETVQEQDPESNVATGRMVPSKAAANLWFVAAKIQSDTETIYPGVWGIVTNADGSADIYAINDVAMELSFADWGEDSEPVLTMQSDGAQAAYDCAMQVK